MAARRDGQVDVAKADPSPEKGVPVEVDGELVRDNDSLGGRGGRILVLEINAIRQ